MDWTVILCAVTLMVGIPFLVVRSVAMCAERSAGLDSLWRIRIIRDKMKLTLGKAYRTRSGYPVTRMEFHVPTEINDGFLWRVTYRLPDGSEDYGWYNDEGRWTNNPFWKTAVDLVEVPA